VDARPRGFRSGRREEAGYLDAVVMSAARDDDDRRFMARALELARRGEGHVEPNPMVGCVLVRDGSIVGEGWHQRFGGPHAEIEALAAAGEAARGATAYVTLEPCAHHGKTPPCTESLPKAGVARVVIACRDPNPQVDGRGLEVLELAGIPCFVGLLAEEAGELIAPFAKLVTQRRPWVIAKWAMTLDGKLATRTGDSRWISGEESRAVVHKLRGRVDAIIVGRGTVEADDPVLTARPPGPRTPMRIVLDQMAKLPLDSQLVRTAGEYRTAVVTGGAPAERCDRLREANVDVWKITGSNFGEVWRGLLDKLGRHEMTNVLVEGGAEILGGLFDEDLINEVHAFIAPKIIGGPAPGAIAGLGVPRMVDASRLKYCQFERTGPDIYIHGRLSTEDEHKLA
jgi:diaminohydroxyphosphoribosylaminopyrimidine deaminase/5-amino-6-(5-phosphoribosylamino)uracil reductase